MIPTFSEESAKDLPFSVLEFSKVLSGSQTLVGQVEWETDYSDKSEGTEGFPLEMGLSELEVRSSMTTRWLQLPAEKRSSLELLWCCF